MQVLFFKNPQYGDQNIVLQGSYFCLLCSFVLCFYENQHFYETTEYLTRHSISVYCLILTSGIRDVGVGEMDLHCHCNWLCNIRG